MPDITGGMGTGSVGTPTLNRAVSLSGWFGQRRFANLSGVQGTHRVGYLSYLESGSHDWFLVDYADRLYPWGDYCGIPGGIPTDRTQYGTTMTSANTLAEINARIQACPAGQYVRLAAGAYYLGQLTFGSKVGVTLLGAGAGQTIIYSTASPSVTVTQRYPVSAGAVTVTSGYTRGSTSIVVASAASFTSGGLIFIDEAGEPDLWAEGLGTYYRVGLTTPWNMTAARCHRFTSRIESIVGTTINLTTPLPFSFNAALSPQAYPLSGGASASLCGLEDLTLVSSGSLDYAVQLIGADRCWTKDVEAYGYVGTTGAIQYQWSNQCEVRRTFVHDCAGYPTQADGYAIFLYYGCSNCRVEDCITDNVATAFVVNGSAGNALIYNYAVDSRRAGHAFLDQAIIFNHGPHSTYNLIEGNVAQRVQDDGTHGNASFTAMFRNHFNGIYPPGGTPTTRRIIDLCRGGYYHTAIGNVIGDASYALAVYDFDWIAAINCCYIMGAPGMDSISMGQFSYASGQPFVGWLSLAASGTTTTSVRVLKNGHFSPVDDFYIGRTLENHTRANAVGTIIDYDADDGTGYAVFTLSGAISGQVAGDEITLLAPDYGVELTLLRNGNYDYYNAAAVWAGGITRSIPNSLFYDSKPTYFGSLAWPAIGPDVSGLVMDTPAKARWDAYLISGNIADLFADAPGV